MTQTSSPYNVRFRTAFTLLMAISALALIGGCRKLIDIDAPRTQVTTEGIFNADVTANTAVAGMYSDMYASNAWSQELTILTGMTADELTAANASTLSAYSAYVNNQILSNDPRIAPTWVSLYRTIYQANSIIKGVAASTGMSQKAKDQYGGEARFIRAINYYYLVSLFGPVPLVTTTAVEQTALAPRADSATVFAQIITDLKDAQAVLAADYSGSSNQRSRANRFAATALLARVYLHVGDYQNAEAQASLVMGNSQYSLVTTANITGINIKNNTEAIWQFDVTGSSFSNTAFLSYVFLPFFGFSPPNIALRPELVNAFQPSDQRLQKWVGRFPSGATTISYPFKYQKNVFSIPNAATDEWHTVLRLGEQYLIRAEARARVNNLTGGLSDLNAIRRRAGLTDTTATSSAALANAVLQERRLELFAENGLRWIDLKRTGSIDALLAPIKPGWQPYKRLYPVPIDEINKNPNLTQNQGY